MCSAHDCNDTPESRPAVIRVNQHPSRIAQPHVRPPLLLATDELVHLFLRVAATWAHHPSPIFP